MSNYLAYIGAESLSHLYGLVALVNDIHILSDTHTYGPIVRLIFRYISVMNVHIYHKPRSQNSVAHALATATLKRETLLTRVIHSNVSFLYGFKKNNLFYLLNKFI